MTRKLAIASIPLRRVLQTKNSRRITTHLFSTEDSRIFSREEEPIPIRFQTLFSPFFLHSLSSFFFSYYIMDSMDTITIYTYNDSTRQYYTYDRITTSSLFIYTISDFIFPVFLALTFIIFL